MDERKIESVGIYANMHKRGVIQVARKLLDMLAELNVVCECELAKALQLERKANFSGLGQCDIVITLGGDGTVLESARNLAKYDVPILGVNLGRLGFLTELLPTELEIAIPEIVGGKFTIDSRMMLEAKILDYSGETLIGLNEVTIDKAGSPRTLHFNVIVSGNAISHIAADGFIVATPTGSTAYSMASGGAIVVPSMNALLLTAIAPYTLAIRPLIVSGDDIIRIEYKNRCLLYTSPSPRDLSTSRMPSSA